MEATPNPFTVVTTVDPPPQKLRLMCSYGGHIIPRPHDKTLSYIGGDTRIVLVDRHVSVGDLHARLSKTLHQNYPFLLKYQIPKEDLDSLISVFTDDDFQNMVEEYDRLANKQGRLRLFLFPKMVQSIDLGQVFGNKGSSEEWFLGILNGTAKSLPSGFTDSVNCLLGLELDEAEKSGDFVSEGAFFEGHLVENERKVVNNGGIGNQDVHSVPDSPIIQANSSSFGSTSSLKSVKMGAVGVEEQLHQMSGVGYAIDNATIADHNQQISRDDAVVVGNCVNNGTVSDDERSDHIRKAQEAVQLIQAQQAHQRQGGVGVLDLPSPDSASSEGSMTNPLSRQRQTIHQEPSIAQIQSVNNHITTSQSDSKVEVQTPIRESSYLLSGLYNPHYHHHHQNPQLHHQQHFVHAGAQYIPVTSYYPVYPHQNHPNPPVLDQSYPVYFIQARPSQAYNLPMQQQNYSDLASNAPPTQPQKPPIVAYNHQVFSVPSSKPDAVTLASTAPPQLVQHQTQYASYAQTMHHPSQSIAPSSSTSKGLVYGYELSDQIHYAQPLPTQYQASSSAMADSSSQINADDIMLKNRALQP